MFGFSYMDSFAISVSIAANGVILNTINSGTTRKLSLPRGRICASQTTTASR